MILRQFTCVASCARKYSIRISLFWPKLLLSTQMKTKLILISRFMEIYSKASKTVSCFFKLDACCIVCAS